MKEKRKEEGIRVTHLAITLQVFEDWFKKGIKASAPKDPLWEGSYLIHSYIDLERRVLHLFYHDPINGTTLLKGQDILTTKLTYKDFFRREKK